MSVENIYTVTNETATPYLPYIYKKFEGELPSCYGNEVHYNEKVYKELKTISKVVFENNKTYHYESLFYVDNIYIYIVKQNDYYYCEYYFKETDRDTVNKYIKHFSPKKYLYKLKVVEDTENLFCLVKSYGGFTLVKNTNKQKKIDINLNYNDHIIEAYDEINSFFNSDASGLILFEGEPGTGKTRLIRHMSMVIDKKFIIIPPTYIPSIGSPEFLPFLLNHRNSVLILEDSDDFLVERAVAGNGQNTAISSILNITDGILSEFLNIKILITFNTDIKKIDKALLRNGRLFKKITFNKLTIEKTNTLLESLGHDHISTHEMTLSDIYNIKKKNLSQPKTTTNKKIGF